MTPRRRLPAGWSHLDDVVDRKLHDRAVRRLRWTPGGDPPFAERDGSVTFVLACKDFDGQSGWDDVLRLFRAVGQRTVYVIDPLSVGLKFKPALVGREMVVGVPDSDFLFFVDAGVTCGICSSLSGHAPELPINVFGADLVAEALREPGLLFRRILRDHRGR